MGFSYHRPWRLGSWDRFAIPKPYSRARALVSEAIQVPPRLDRAGIEQYRQRIEQRLCQLTERAEQWAEEGYELPGALPLRRARVPRTSQARTQAGVDPQKAVDKLSFPQTTPGDRHDAA